MSHLALWMAPSCVCAETLCSFAVGTRRAKQLGQGFMVVLKSPQRLQSTLLLRLILTQLPGAWRGKGGYE